MNPVPLLLASTLAATPVGAVTRSEFNRIEPGMSRERVERIFDAGPGRCALRYVLRGKRIEGRQYPAPSAKGTEFKTTIYYRLTPQGAVVFSKDFRDPPVTSNSC